MALEASKAVCVMDAAGRLGSTLVHRLLLRGYTVHATVQNRGLFSHSYLLSFLFFLFLQIRLFIMFVTCGVSR